MKPRILITGASGFIGTRLVDQLSNRQYQLVLVSRQRQDVAKPGIRHLTCDLTDARSVRRLAERLGKCDLLVHLAAIIPSTPEEDGDFDRTFRDGLALTANLLPYIRPQYIVYGSTIDVYGAIKKNPIDEHHPIAPRTYYGAAKAASEACISAFAAKREIPLAILRFSQVYGPGDTSTKLIPQVIQRVFDGGRPILHGTGSDTRDFLHVDDAVRAIVCALRLRPSGVFNIGTGRATSIREAVTRIIASSGRSIRPIHRPAQKPLSKMRYDTRAARRKLRFSARISFAEGIASTVREVRPLLVLDWDGTLLDVEKRYFQIYRRLMSDRPKLTRSRYWRLKRRGVPETDIVARTVRDAHFIRVYVREWKSMIEDTEQLSADRLRPGVLSALRMLSRKLTLVLVSTRRNRANLSSQLHALDVFRFFDTVVSMGPSRTRSAVERKAHSLAQCEGIIQAVVGDTPDDMKLAALLNVRGIAMTRGIRTRRLLEISNPDYFIESVRDLPKLLTRLNIN